MVNIHIDDYQIASNFRWSLSNSVGSKISNGKLDKPSSILRFQRLESWNLFSRDIGQREPTFSAEVGCRVNIELNMKLFLIQILRKFRLLGFLNILVNIKLNNKKFKVPILKGVGLSNTQMSES